ncbi:UDP-N-acetylglucosamine 4,6-dehydratase (inverting) [Amylibacter sp.]|nr:UDP-N-acetylglucosamine 4,6-dehydratase (inverting) [Amylibacter sp.]
MFNKKNILITGGTGSFGQKFTKLVLDNYNPSRLIIFSRDEMKQWEMAKSYANDDRIRFFIGDVRDANRLRRAFDGVDYVVHAAATKIVPTAEYNPFECVKTNIDGARNVIDAAIDANVETVVALSTDKASSPVNLYGATKLVSDKLFISGNAYTGKRKTKFSVVRYGNVMGSRGSVLPFFYGLKDAKELPITDSRMTRFMLPLEEAVKLVWLAFETCVGGEIYIKKSPSMNITEIAQAINPNAKMKLIGIRPGEKLHEQMIGFEDAPFTYDFGNYFKILPNIHGWADDPARIKNGKKVTSGFVYSSNANEDWMSVADLSIWIQSNLGDLG